MGEKPSADFPSAPKLPSHKCSWLTEILLWLPPPHSPSSPEDGMKPSLCQDEILDGKFGCN